MNVKVRRALVAVVGILFCGVAFYFAFTRSFEFGVAHALRGTLDSLPPPVHALYLKVLAHLPVDEDPSAWFVRKTASVVFFGAVGAIVRFVVGRRIASRPSRGWLVIGAAVAMSAAIELYEYPESLGDEAFDLACGFVGGAIAAGILRLFKAL